MSTPPTPEVAQAFLDANFAPWVRALKPQVTAIHAEGANLRIPISAEIERVGGIVSGQTLATLADTAMVIACGGAAGEMVPVGTVTLETHFMRPASGTHIDAEASILRAGRGMIFARCLLIAYPSGKPVASASATFAR